MRPAHIIIEGPDGAGKTTLAKVLCSALSMDYHHEGPPPQGVKPYDHYRNVYRELTHPTVIDRFHLGEIVYGPLLREKSGLAPAEVFELNRIIEARNGRVIVCLPPWETCLENNEAKWDKELIQDEITLHAAYDAWAVLVRNPTLFTGRVYNYTAMEANRVAL